MKKSGNVMKKAVYLTGNCLFFSVDILVIAVYIKKNFNKFSSLFSFYLSFFSSLELLMRIAKLKENKTSSSANARLRFCVFHFFL